MLWTVCVLLLVALGTSALWWGWRHVDDLPVGDAGPIDAGWARLCLGPIVAPAAVARPSWTARSTEAELACRLLAGGITAERYRAEMERLAAADADHPMTTLE